MFGFRRVLWVAVGLSVMSAVSASVLIGPRVQLWD